MTASSSLASDFNDFVKNLWPAAKSAGVSRQIFEKAFDGVTPDPDVLKKANEQPEFKLTIQDYVTRLVTQKRIAAGLAAMQNNAGDLEDIERKYGVSRYILAAIWGIESNYGATPGTKNVIRSLATLAYTGRRQRFGKQQLVSALKILQRGDVAPEAMVGSWAGAMGHTQFIPTTYNAYAVDYTRDGKRDIWGSAADALASSANYLRASGWQQDKTWGYEVVVPPAMKQRMPSRGSARTIAAWQKLGVARADGEKFTALADRASLFFTAGTQGPVFLLKRNFAVIKRYNNADAYALAVGLLANRLAGSGDLQSAWPEKIASPPPRQSALMHDHFQ